MRRFPCKSLMLAASATVALLVVARNAHAAVRLGVELGNTNRGTQVLRVYRGGYAYRMGLRPEDVLYRINGQRVWSAGQAARILADSNAAVVVWRRGGSYYRGRAGLVIVTGGEGGGEREVVEAGREIDDRDAED